MTNLNSTDLQDCDTPESVTTVLRNAARRYAEASSELASAWQDPNAGKVWDKLAKALETCARRCEVIAKSHY